MKTKITLLVILMLMFLASPALAVELDELPEFYYKIGQIKSEPAQNNIEPEKPGFWASRDPWTKQDTYWQTGLTLLNIVDYKTTKENIHAGGYEWGYAKNFIGEHPSDDDLKQYFSTVIIIDFITSYILPKKWRRLYQQSGIIIEFYYIKNSR